MMSRFTLPPITEGPGDEACDDCGDAKGFSPNVAAYKEFGVRVCYLCAERRFRREYLNSVESRADRAFDRKCAR